MNHEKDIIAQSVSNLLPDFSYFDEYIKFGNTKTINFEIDSAQIMLPIEKQNNIIYSHPRIFATDFYSSSKNIHNIPLIDLFERLRNSLTYPLVYKIMPSYIIGSSRYLREAEIYNRYTTSVIDLENYKMNKLRLRNLEHAKSRFVFEQVGLSDISLVWPLMQDFLATRKLSHLTTSRVYFLVEKYPHLFTVSRVLDEEGFTIAVALHNRIGPCERVPNYFGSREHKGATEMLLDGIVLNAMQANLETVDLGISMDPNTNMEVKGIVDFKASMSAQRAIFYNYLLK